MRIWDPQVGLVGGKLGTFARAGHDVTFSYARVVAHTSSAAEELAKKAKKARIVSAFGTVPSEVLFDVFEAKRRKNKPSLVYCGDDKKAKKVAATLIRDIGFEPIDVGALQNARYTEPFSLLIAYESGEGPEVAYRFERF